MSGEKHLEIVIVGGGIAGLAIAYGLLSLPRVRVRIFERRKETDCAQGGYPIHLSADGRQALSELLTPKDYMELLTACDTFSASHDGVAILKSSGKVAWRMVQSPGTKCLLERQRLIDILKNGLDRRLALLRVSANDVPETCGMDYDKGVKSIKKTMKGWELALWDGETVGCDLLIGADGMFSMVRRTLYPPRPGIKDQGFQALPWTTVNLRSTSAAVKRWVGDEDAMNMIYGKGWSAAFMPLTADVPPARQAVAKTAVVSATAARRPDHGEDRLDQPVSDPHGSHTTLCADVYHTSTQPEVMEGKTDYPCYVALTIPHPATSIRDAIHAFPESKVHGSFLHDILADPGLTNAQSFPLWTSLKTCVGGQRAVLVGDASHGMVPYCGAGASAGLKDAVDLVKALQNHTVFGENLDYLLGEFYAEQKISNDPLIQQSRRVLWIAQGNNLAKRVLRSTVFAVLETMEKMGEGRSQADAKLRLWKAFS